MAMTMTQKILAKHAGLDQYPSCSALSLCEQPLFSIFSAIGGHSSFLGHTQDSY